MGETRVLVVDLNNFARYPTLSVGYIIAVCRRAGMSVKLFSPLSVGLKGVARERPASALTLAASKANYLAFSGRFAAMRPLRRWAASAARMPIKRRQGRVLEQFTAHIERDRPDIVLISTYLAFRELTASMCRVCEERRVRVVIGGPYFAQPQVIREWINISGLTALAAGEVELDLPQIIESLLGGEDATRFVGVIVPDGPAGYRGRMASPLHQLDDVPYPDFTDFPWDRYPERIVPVVTGRGCGWGVCAFCSDVTSTAGRTFRSRSPENVLGEVRSHHDRYGATLFVFTDLKLNSNLEMWRAIARGMQDAAPGARWIASVHVGRHRENGLTSDELHLAADSGCVRLTTGLESGSQRVLELMRKGSEADAIGAYLHDATRAQINTRCTMIAGYPGEQADDVYQSTRFVRAHAEAIERISLNPFRIITGTPAHTALDKGKLPDVADARPHHRLAVIDHHPLQARSGAYRRVVMQLYDAVHAVNRKPLHERARVFEGVM